MFDPRTMPRDFLEAEKRKDERETNPVQVVIVDKKQENRVRDNMAPEGSEVVDRFEAYPREAERRAKEAIKGKPALKYRIYMIL